MMRPSIQLPRWLLGALIACLFLPQVVSAETVLARRRLGNNTEGMTYDPLRDRAYAIDGNDVVAIALADGDELGDIAPSEISGLGFRKAFDVLGLDPQARVPRGIVYVPTQRRFYFSSVLPAAGAQLFSTDQAGHPKPTLSLKGLDTTSWLGWEGLAWIPPDAPTHGGTIAGLGSRSNDSLSHVFYVRLDGAVEAEVVPQVGTPLEDGLCGIQYWPQRPGTLLVSVCGANAAWAMDMQTGALVGEPTRPALTVPEADFVESIVVRRSGQVLLGGYESGRLYAFDRSLARTAGQDRLFVIGLGVSAARLGWNFDTGELLAVTPQRVVAISPDLRSARHLFDLDVNQEVGLPTYSGIAYLGNGQVALGYRFFPRGIDIADLATGHSLSRLLFFPQQGFPAGRAFAVLGVGAYGPDQFLVRTAGDANALQVVSRSGAPDASTFPDGVLPDGYTQLPLSSPTKGAEAQLFDAGAGPRLFTGAEIYDLAGTLLHEVDAPALGLQGSPPGTSLAGVWMFGNTFAAQDGGTSTVVVYTIP
jgi:hypothetical protein